MIGKQSIEPMKSFKQGNRVIAFKNFCKGDYCLGLVTYRLAGNISEDEVIGSSPCRPVSNTSLDHRHIPASPQPFLFGAAPYIRHFIIGRYVRSSSWVSEGTCKCRDHQDDPGNLDSAFHYYQKSNFVCWGWKYYGQETGGVIICPFWPVPCFLFDIFPSSIQTYWKGGKRVLDPRWEFLCIRALFLNLGKHH